MYVDVTVFVGPSEVCSLPHSLAKHRIGTKRHRVCLEIPQEVSQSELFPKEELSSGQYDVAECQAALAPVRPTHSSVRQVEDALPFPGLLAVMFSPQCHWGLLWVRCHVVFRVTGIGGDGSVGREW